MNFGFCASLLVSLFVGSSALQVGIGIHDVTGPVAGINLMGYAMIDQINHGLHNRLRSRCFIFVSSADDGIGASLRSNDKRMVYCSVDTAMISPNIKNGVIRQLQESFGDLYSHQNVMLSSTHTHAAPGGYHDYLLYAITSLGHIRASADDMIYGIAESIRRAHENVRSAKLGLRRGELRNANINRSPSAYEANKEEYKKRYADQGNTDKTMTVVKIRDQSDSLRGMMGFFSVHCTSMNNTNPLVSGDNKGYASWLMERDLNSQIHGLNTDNYQPYSDPEVAKLISEGRYVVASFGQTQEGDVSPNTEGSFCLDTGAPCDYVHSTCPNRQGQPRNKLCHARGPGWDKGDEESTRLIGLRQYLKAKSLLNSADEDELELEGDLDYGHAWVAMSNTSVILDDGSAGHTCLPARGYSFAAGTTDGPGEFDFVQSDNTTGNPFWNFVRQFIKKPSVEQQRCHAPKPILLDTGEITFPYLWEPRIVDIQIFRIGNLLILAVPAEFTTMAGRLLREAIQDLFVQAGVVDSEKAVTLIAGLSNAYSGYVTTFEEYHVQRYEGASTIYGPHTLRAYIQEFKRLAMTMLPEDRQPRIKLPEPSYNPTVQPTDFSERLLSFLAPVIFDSVPLGRRFGQVVPGKDVKSEYRVGELAQVTFYTGHPRNMARDPQRQLETSFVYVEKYVGPSLEQVQTAVEVWARDQFGASFVGEVELIHQPDLTRDMLQFNVTKTTRSRLVIQESEGESSAQVDVQREYQSVYVTHRNNEIRVSHDQEGGDPMWIVVRDDDDWDVKFRWWKPVPGISSLNYGKVEWRIGARPDVDVVRTQELYANPDNDAFLDISTSSVDKALGTYRIRFHGAHKSPNGVIHKHEGLSQHFGVVV